jgi:hypothetical protein
MMGKMENRQMILRKSSIARVRKMMMRNSATSK